MQLSAIDRIEPAPAFDQLPIVLEQRPSKVKAIGLALLSVPVIVALLVPFVLILALAVLDPSALPAVSSDTATGVQLSLGLLVGAGIVAIPVRGLLGRLRRGQTVRIDGERVLVEDRGLWRARAWQVPLSSYAGVTEHLRASLSGTRYELILVHPQSDRSVLLAFADKPGTIQADAVATLLRLPQIPARDLYRRGAVQPAAPRELEAA